MAFTPGLGYLGGTYSGDDLAKLKAEALEQAQQRERDQQAALAAAMGANGSPLQQAPQQQQPDALQQPEPAPMSAPAPAPAPSAAPMPAAPPSMPLPQMAPHEQQQAPSMQALMGGGQQQPIGAGYTEKGGSALNPNLGRRLSAPRSMAPLRKGLY